MRLRIAPTAQRELDHIWDYTCDRWDVDQADEYLRDLRRAMERIADNPKIGRACDDLRAGYLRLTVGAHILYYRVGDDVVDIMRVLHQRMDPERHL